MNKYLAFDIEIAKVMTTGETDWKAQRPLGISCAATFDQVLQYVAQDVRITLQIAQAVEQCKEIRWTSDKGRPNVIEIDKWLTVSESLRLPEPDTSWMDSPPTRAQLIAWTQVATSRPSKRVVNHMERVFDALRLKGEEVPLRDAYWLKQWQRLLSNWN